MPNTESMKEVVAGVAGRLKPNIKTATSSAYPWLFVPTDAGDKAVVKDQWLRVTDLSSEVAYAEHGVE